MSALEREQNNPEHKAPKWEKDRFITLDGYNINSDGNVDGPMRKAFKDASIQSWAGSSALNLLASQELVGPVFGGLLLATHKFLEHKALSEHFGKSALNTKCIDTRPDNTVNSNSEEYKLAAYALKKLNNSAIGFMSSWSLVTGSTGVFILQDVNYAFSTLSIYSGILTDNIRGRKRFQNIENDTWQIVDWPEP